MKSFDSWKLLKCYKINQPLQQYGSGWFLGIISQLLYFINSIESLASRVRDNQGCVRAPDRCSIWPVQHMAEISCGSFYAFISCCFFLSLAAKNTRFTKKHSKVPPTKYNGFPSFPFLSVRFSLNKCKLEAPPSTALFAKISFTKIAGARRE